MRKHTPIDNSPDLFDWAEKNQTQVSVPLTVLEEKISHPLLPDNDEQIIDYEEIKEMPASEIENNRPLSNILKQYYNDENKGENLFGTHEMPPASLKKTIQPNNITETPCPAPQQKNNGPFAQDNTCPVQDRKQKIFRTGQIETKKRTPSKIIADNINAIRLIKSKKHFTEEEKAQLLKYAGWGSCAEIFSSINKYYCENNHYKWKESHRHSDTYLNEYKILKTLMSESEMKDAEKSTTTAYYTPDFCIKGMYKILERLNFKGGRILEPAAGTGRFIALSPEFEKKTKWTAIEMDRLTAQILAAIQNDIEIINSPYQEYKATCGTFDLAITNVPFSTTKVYDPEFNKKNFKLHDYFITKSFELLKENGLLAVITATSTMDNSSVLKYLHTKGAALLCAFRLPKETFETTKTMADILIFAKTEKESAAPPSWTGTANLTFDDPASHKQQEIQINRYYAENRGRLLGDLQTEYRYGIQGCLEISGSPADMLDRELDKIDWDEINQKITQSKNKKSKDNNNKIIKDNNNQIIKDNNNQIIKDEENQIIKDAKPLCHALKNLLGKSATSDNESELEEFQRQLNAEYDNFVFRNGCINQNIKHLKGMTEFPNLLALETYDKEKQSAKKTEIFSKRIISPLKKPSRAENVEDAVWISINETCEINVERISQLLGKTKEEAINELMGSDEVFLNPETEKFEIRSEYLSGKIINKLEAAKRAAAESSIYEKNCKELMKVQPEKIEYSQIKCRPGAAWIPEEDIAGFLAEITESNSKKWSVKHCKFSGTWIINCTDQTIRNNIKNTSEYGYPDMRGDEIFKHMVNGQNIKIFKKDNDGKQYFDAKSTAIAHEKMGKIEKFFETWIWSDEERRTRLETLYNDIFNSEIPRNFECKRLEMPGISDIWRKRIESPERQYQKNAIYRAIHGGSALLAHCVGAGKTLEMAIIGMELKRLQLAKKPLYVVPNHMLEQWAADFKSIYPSAEIMIVYKEFMVKEKRRQTIAKIALKDFDAIIMAHSTFNKIGVSKKLEEEYVQEQLDELEYVIDQAKNEEDTSAGRRTTKQLAKMKEKLEERIKKLNDKDDKDRNITFEELNIDYLFIDEAHNFKGLPIFTKKGNISGIQIQTSQKAVNMELKVIYVRDRIHKGRRGAIFATGTAISNSISEAYVMMRYLDPENMKDKGIHSFDDWAGTFGKTVTELEIKPTGAGYRMNTRFSDFSNLPELKKMFRKFADVIRTEDISINKPEIIDGKPVCVQCKISEAQRAYVKILVKRSEKLSEGDVDPKEDNMLKITTEARKLSLSPHLLLHSNDKTQIEHPENKIKTCAENIYKIWKSSATEKCTQLAFSDLGVPNEGNYSVYADLKEKLIALGIPEKEINFIHDAETDNEKADLFKKVRDGACRILIGNTQKMGEGTNVQNRLLALHNLDVPWKPAHYEQRLGRILRPGNMNKRVYIYNYASEESFDAYMWQTVERKAKSIHKFMDPSLTEREYEGDATSFTAAEMKAIASENPVIREKIMLEISLQKLRVKEDAHHNDRHQKQRAIKNTEFNLKLTGEKIKMYMEVDSIWNSENKEFRVQYENSTLEEKEKIIEHLQDRCKAIREGRENCVYAGRLLDKMELTLQRDLSDIIIKLRHMGREINLAKMANSNIENAITTAKRTLSELGADIKKETENYARNKKQLDDLIKDSNNNEISEIEKEIAGIKARIAEIETALKINESDMQADSIGGDKEETEEGENAA